MTGTALAQNPGDARVLKMMDDGVAQMERGAYAEAEKSFLFVLNNITPLPSEMAFYFGKNSYHLKKWKQSINWLNKYVQLKGTQGRFHSEARELLELAEAAYLEQHKQNKSTISSNDLSGGDYDCGGLNKMICPVCKGEGVILVKNPFDRRYKTCPYSAGEAYLTCEEYNLFMRGELDPKIN